MFDNGLCSLLSRLVPEGEEATAPLPGNLRLWDDDARILLRAFPPGSLRRVFSGQTPSPPGSQGGAAGSHDGSPRRESFAEGNDFDITRLGGLGSIAALYALA